MGFAKVFSLSLESIKTNFKYSLAMVLGVGAVLGVVFAVNFWFKGLENTYVDLAGRATDGKVVVLASNDAEGFVSGNNGDLRASRAEMVNDIERFGGEVLGDLRMYDAQSILVDESVVGGAVEINVDETPDDAVPILVSPALGQQLLNERFLTDFRSVEQGRLNYEEYRQRLLGQTFRDMRGNKIFVVGLAPGGFGINNLSFSEMGCGNVMDFLLSGVAVPNSTILAIKNGGAWEDNSDNFGVMQGDLLVAVFANIDDAYGYLEHGNGKFLSVELSGRSYIVRTIAGMPPDVSYVFKTFGSVIGVGSIIVALIVALVIVFANVRLTERNKQVASRYRKVGVASRQVWMVYAWYFGELMLMALVLAFCVSVLITIVFSAANQELLGTQFMLAFSLPERPKIMLYGPSAEVAVMAIIVLASALLSSLVSRRGMQKRAKRR